MSKYERVALGSLVNEYSERNKALACTDVYSVTNSEGFTPSADYFSKEVFSKNISSYKIVREGMFAYNPSRVNVGSIAWLDCKDIVVISPMYVVFKIDENSLTQPYLDYFLHSNLGIAQIRGLTSGSVRDTLKYSALEQIKIPLPSLDDQRRIAATLEKAQHLIASRREQIAVLDKLAHDLFFEMFGNLTFNSMGWDILNFTDVAIIDTRMTSDFEKYAECYHIGIENIEKNTGNIVNPIKVKDSGLISGKYPFNERHIIYSKIRPNLNKVALPDFEGVCSADAYPILVKNGVCERIYLATVMRSDYFLSYILGYSNRSNIPKVNKTQLSGFNLPVPPIEKQRDFSMIIQKNNQQKSRLTASLAELETLYQSLTERAFSGELFG